MAFADKLKFWKKDDDLGLDKDPFAPSGNDNPAQGPFAGQGQTDPAQQAFGQQQPADPFATGQGNDPFSQQTDPAQQAFGQQQPADPFATGQGIATQGDMPFNPQGTGQQQAAPQPFGRERYPMHAEPVQEEKIADHNLELILTRLDILKAMLEGINQRLANIERSHSNEYKW